MFNSLLKPNNAAAVVLISMSTSAFAASDTYELSPEVAIEVLPAGENYSPWVGRDFPQRPLFGDTHLHTSLSFDAISFGTTVTPEMAYRFTKGEEVRSSTGVPAKLGRPLDFVVIADHSELIGTMGAVKAGIPELMSDPTVRGWHENLMAGGEEALKPYLDIVELTNKGEDIPAVLSTEKFFRSTWEDVINAADDHNEPGVFTAFIGYEWSSNDAGNNLHRVVIHRGDADDAKQYLPVSSEESPNPEDLWERLDAYQERTGDQVLAIAHNGNLSNGKMFEMVEYDGSPISAAWAERRARLEPLYEATQIKGDGETHPFLSPTDEFADFETWDIGNLDLSVPKTPEMLPHEYARSALKLGLSIEKAVGINPYKFGLIGSTDSHTGLPAIAEDNFFGKLPSVEPSAQRMERDLLAFGDLSYKATDTAASGYAAVWALENTRESIFDAMQRRETYATTGPRMMVRLFGGWEFTEEDAANRRPANVGYRKGVPMGGNLFPNAEAEAPTFLVGALKDPIGANLDRYQIIKGWLDADGELHEQVYDVAWSGDRVPGEDGKLPLVGNTVDVQSANFLNTIGATELVGVWEDPDFNPEEPAFYYGRVLEIPTPRWPAYDAKYFNVDVPEGTRMVLQERAYTSPIWYTPE
ncbi:MAG: DUF3604 domain-containing protein [Roseobacter sp.]